MGFPAVSAGLAGSNSDWPRSNQRNGPGCSVFSAAILTWSVRAVESLAISSNCLCALQQHGLQLHGILGLVAQQFVTRPEIRRGRFRILARMRHRPSTSTRTVPSGNFTIFGQARNAPDIIQIFRGRLGNFGLALQTQRQTGRSPDTMSSINLRLGPGFDEQGHDGTGKNHDVRKAEDGHDLRQRTGGKYAANPPLFRRRR